jgi:carbamoyltransferase
VLADPRRAAVKERINRRIKHREPFRPLAPIVLAKNFDEYFGPPGAADPFMLIVATATPECRRVAPAVVHVDGTSRVQVVGPDGDPFLVRLLSAFHAETGVPMLLNTSFNRRGEPIVETPEDAVAAFLDMGLDGLWMDGLFLYRPA